MDILRKGSEQATDLSSISKQLAIGLALAAFGSVVVIFGALYTTFDLLRNADGSDPDLTSSLFFSLVTQSTVGFGDVVASGGAGEAVVAVQIGFGVVWSAFVPALVVYRLLLPDDADLHLGPFLIFNPDHARFRIRIANRGKTTGSGVMVRAWLRRVDVTTGTRKHHSVGIGSGIEASSRFPLLLTDAPFYINFDTAREQLGDITDDSVGLHPLHITTATEVLVEVEMRSRFGTVVRHHAFKEPHIVCGDGVDVQPVVDGPKTWSTFTRVTLRNSTPTGHERCLGCGFRGTCSLRGKVN